MDELVVVLFVLGIILAVVTLVGHGIWVLLSFLFRGGRRSTATMSTAAHPRHRFVCEKCGATILTSSATCDFCGCRRPNAERAEERIALLAMREQIEQFTAQHAIDDNTRGRLLSAIDEEVRRLDQELVLIKTQVAADTAVPAAPLATSPTTSVAEPVAAAQPAMPATPTPLPLHERARMYATRREAAAAQPSEEVVTPVEPPKKREALSRLFAAFMEEKNIRWGELVGGLLIVGCSIALVISFWSQIAAQPLLKFVLFNGVTAALFGVGLYTDSRWKIHTTSHGVLVIATLLVPLNFLAIAAFTQASPPTDLLSLAGEGASLVVFSLLIYVAGRVLVPDDKIPLVGGVMIPCLMQLLVRRFAHPLSPLAQLYALAAFPIASYIATTAYCVRRRWTHSDLMTETEAHRILVVVGLISVSTMMPIALLLHNVRPIATTLHWLSPVLMAFGLPALSVGLLFWRGLTDRGLAGLQTAGIGVGALGAMVMLAALAFAWPDPATLLPTSLVLTLVMVGVALGFEIPAAILPAAAGIAAASLVGFYLIRGDIGWTLENASPIKNAILSATSGNVLVAVVAVFGALARLLRGGSRKEESKMLGIAAAAAAAASLALIVRFGFARAGDPTGATWSLAIYAAAAIAAAIALERPLLVRVGSALLFASLVQAIVYRFDVDWQLEHPWITALLTHATLVAIGCTLLARVDRKRLASSVLSMARRSDVIQSFLFTAHVTSLAAAAGIIATIQATPAIAAGVNLAWVAGGWLLLAALTTSPAWFTASQVAIVAAIICGVITVVEDREWYASSNHPWLDPWFVEAQGVALAIFCIVLGIVRQIVVRLGRASESQVVTPPTASWLTSFAKMIDPPWPAVDRVVAVGLVGLLAVVAAYAAAPGAAQEWSPTEALGSRVAPPIERFEVAGIPHSHAADRGAWLLLIAVFTAIALSLYRNTTSRLRTIGLVIVAMAICLLLASRWEAQVSVASALRWLSAGTFALASVVIWNLPRSGDTGDASVVLRKRSVRDPLVAFAFLVYVAMAAFVGQASLLQSSMDSNLRTLWPGVLIWTVAVAMAGLVGSWAIDKQVPPTAGAHRVTTYLPYARNLLLLFAFAPIAILAAFSVAKALDARPLVGPDPSSWFARLGVEASYGIPLVILALTFVGYAVRDRSSGFAFAAGLLFNTVATIVVLLRFARGAGTLDTTAWITVAQVNAVVSGVVALVWLGATKFVLSDVKPRSSLLLVTQVALAAALCGFFLIPAVVVLTARISPLAWIPSADGYRGWCAVALAAAAAFWLHQGRVLSQRGAALFIGAIVALASLTAARYDTGNLLAYHTLLAGCCAAAWILPPATRLANSHIAESGESPVQLLWSAPSSRLFAIAAVFLVFWSHSRDPHAPWWSVAALVAISARNIWIAYREGGRQNMWIAALLFNFAMSVLWVDWGRKFTPSRGPGAFCEFLWINALAAAVMAIVSAWLERSRQAAHPHRGLAFHRFAAWAIVLMLLLTTSAGLIADLMQDSFASTAAIAWAASLAAALVAAACLWDPAARWSAACLYCVGLIAVGMYLDGLNLHAPLFQWALANALAAYLLFTSAVWSTADRLKRTAARLGLNLPNEPAGHGWLVTVNLLLGIGVLLLVVWIELAIENFGQRMVAAYAVGAQVFAIGLLAHGAVRTRLQYLALVWGVFFAIAFGWAWLPPNFEAPWLHRLVVAVVALAATIVLYGFGLVKFYRRENEWTRAAALLVPSLTGIAAALILLVLALEVVDYVQTQHVSITPAALAAVAVALAGLAAATLVAALVPGRDPLGLSERGRTAYVYAAEALAALLFLHIRVTMDWLFTGWFLRFWPLIVMLIAFVGVGLAELFQRRRQRVLSEPLETTGAMLPLLPALGFWIVSSQVHYSLLLLSIGVLYAALSALRGSLLYGILAAIAANGSLWYLLSQRDGLELTQHPQLWLIPPALCALAAGYINRNRLSQEQSAALRYASAIVIYVSSTADIFINGVAEARWLPAVLAGLSILGVLAGIMLRVQSFLYLGIMFLVIALLTIIWHAAEQWTWLWWVAGIITGIFILAVFGLIEKRRDDVKRVVEELKHWHA